MTTIFIETERHPSRNLIIGCVYMAPGTSLDNFQQSFDSCLNIIAIERKLCYIMGEYNLELLRYRTHQLTDDYFF